MNSKDFQGIFHRVLNNGKSPALVLGLWLLAYAPESVCEDNVDRYHARNLQPWAKKVLQGEAGIFARGALAQTGNLINYWLPHHFQAVVDQGPGQDVISLWIYDFEHWGNPINFKRNALETRRWRFVSIPNCLFIGTGYGFESVVHTSVYNFFWRVLRTAQWTLDEQAV